MNKKSWEERMTRTFHQRLHLYSEASNKLRPKLIIKFNEPFICIRS
jgi:hypothetical protein